MPKPPTIAVDGRLLKWARETAGLSLTKLAARINVKRSVLEDWESTGAHPTARKLEKLSDVTKRPLAAFFLPAPPAEPELPDFRLPPSEGPPVKTSSTLFAIRRAQRLQGVFANLAHELGEGATRLPVIGPNDSPEEAAATARDVVGVSLQDQTGWKDPDVALKVWRSRLESLGVLVFQFAMPPEEVSGFSLSNGVPVIALNRKDPTSRRVFTLFHEWAHLLRGEAGLCSVVEAQGREDGAEVFCNAFAGALLVPIRAFEESAPVVAYREGRASLVDSAKEGAALFSVSRYVVLRRFLTAHAISRDVYRRTIETWERETRPPRKKAKGGAPPYVMTVSELGSRFVGRVLSAHERGLIGDGDLADYLTLRLKHLDRIYELVPVP